MSDKYFLKDEDSQYGEGVMLDEYNGKYSLVSARESNNGEIFMQWTFPQKRDGSKTPIDKAVPWKVTFGSKAQMVNALRYFLGLLEKGPEGTNPGDKTPDGDEIPF